MKKKLLFVINTLGKAGAEMSLVEMLRNIDPEKYEIDLYVLLGQGELISQVPEYINILNKEYDATPVLSREGRMRLKAKAWRALHGNGGMLRKLPYIWKNLWSMVKKKDIKPDKILWRYFAQSGERFNKKYDLAVAYLEGGSTYYVADYVNAARKISFVHVDYRRAGYTTATDGDCYDKIDKIYTVSQEITKNFLDIHPECRGKMDVFENIVDQERIKNLADQPGGFADESGEDLKLLTVGRLTAQKSYDYAIRALRILIDKGVDAKWYVLGDGDLRKNLEREIERQGLQGRFILLGAVDNPYPYYRQCDIYVHATKYEGKSIAIQEAKTLGCAVVVSDRSGNREQIEDGVNGLLCPMDSQGIADAIIKLYEDKNLLEQCKKIAAQEVIDNKNQLEHLLADI